MADNKSNIANKLIELNTIINLTTRSI